MTSRLLLWLLLCSQPLTVLAGTPTYAIIIGNNRAPVDDPSLPALQYADDDAAAMYELLVDLGVQATLLAVLDPTSQALYPRARDAARTPNKAQLDAALSGIADKLAAHRGNADLLFYYSGHGSVRPPEAPRLALLDTALTQRVLYDEVIAPLNTRYTHLLIDACHAAAIVRPRGTSELSSAPLDAQAIGALWKTNTLARFPHTGALIAASANDETHEWSELAHGVFTHELLSGLRGAADVNADGRIEYSELHAFIASANERVADARAKPRVSATPPQTNQHAALVELTAPAGATGWLEGTLSRVGRIFIETARGVRLLDVHAEAGHALRILVPSQEELFVRSEHDEARVVLARAETQSLAALSYRPSSTQARGAIDEAYARGLFKAQFGPAYYQGFVAGAGIAPVELHTPRVVTVSEAPRTSVSGNKAITIAAAAVGAVALVGAGTFAGLAIDARNRSLAPVPPPDDLPDDSDSDDNDDDDAIAPAATRPDPTAFAITASALGAAAAVAAVLVAVYWPRNAPALAFTADVSARSASFGLVLRY